MSAGFFDGIAQQPFDLRGFPARAPLFYREARGFAGLFLADLDAARALLPTPRHHLLRLVPGHALAVVACLEYRDTDIGPYSEVAIAVAATRGWRPLADVLALLDAVRRRRFPAHIAALPVSTEVALWGGLDVFGYPKSLAAISFSDEVDRVVCRVADPRTGELILAARGARPAGRRAPQRVTMITHPVLAGVTLEARLDASLDEVALSAHAHDLHLELGAHPTADVLRRLRLGRLLGYAHAPRFRAILWPPRPAGLQR